MSVHTPADADEHALERRAAPDAAAAAATPSLERTLVKICNSESLDLPETDMIFQVFDRDSSGYIDTAELDGALNQVCKLSQVLGCTHITTPLLIAAKRAQSNRWVWAALTGMGQIANAKTKAKRQFQQADIDQDGMLNIAEFERSMRNVHD